MSSFKLVPLEPTDVMGIAGCEAVAEREPVAWMIDEPNTTGGLSTKLVWARSGHTPPSYGQNHRGLYTAPQAAGQQPVAVPEIIKALEKIAAWPDGGSKYGQKNIKSFASSALAAYRNGGES